jgi:hypothetical protein
MKHHPPRSTAWQGSANGASPNDPPVGAARKVVPDPPRKNPSHLISLAPLPLAARVLIPAQPELSSLSPLSSFSSTHEPGRSHITCSPSHRMSQAGKQQQGERVLVKSASTRATQGKGGGGRSAEEGSIKESEPVRRRRAYVGCRRRRAPRAACAAAGDWGSAPATMGTA